MFVVCRLHLLSSGGAAGARCAAWRLHQRGGYASADDPALRLRAHRPALLRRLRTAHLAEVPIGMYAPYPLSLAKCPIRHLVEMPICIQSRTLPSLTV